MNLPPLKPSDRPEPRIIQWSKLEMEFIQDYARHAAAELALASDARIAEIEKNAHIEISRQRSENIELDMRIAELEQDNASLREQNTIVDAKCAELEAALREVRAVLKVDDEYGLYDTVCDALKGTK